MKSKMRLTPKQLTHTGEWRHWFSWRKHLLKCWNYVLIFLLSFAPMPLGNCVTIRVSLCLWPVFFRLNWEPCIMASTITSWKTAGFSRKLINFFWTSYSAVNASVSERLKTHSQSQALILESGVHIQSPVYGLVLATEAHWLTLGKDCGLCYCKCL